MPAPSENYYDDSPAAPAAGPGDQPEKPESESQGETSILPKSFFGDRELKPGEKCDVEIVAVHESDVEVKGCDSAEKPESESQDMGGEMAGKAAMPTEMQSMME